MTTTLAPTTRRTAQAAAARSLGFGQADWPALGTTAHVLVADAGRLPAARAAVESVLADVDAAASRFRPDSELSRLNARAGTRQPVSPLLAGLLAAALDAAEQTGGLVDPTVGAALVRLGYDRTYRHVPPDGPAVTVAVEPAPGWCRVELSPGHVRVPAGTLLDLGATAKGLAADLAAAAAATAAGCDVLVNLGGDMAVRGDTAWPVLVTDRSDLDLPLGGGQTVRLTTGGLATSGTATRRWRRGGSLLHHLIDPRSGLPTAGPWRTVSVAAPTCLAANTASTAAMVLGADATGWLAAQGVPARLVRDDGAIVTLGGWPADESTDESGAWS